MFNKILMTVFGLVVVASIWSVTLAEAGEIISRVQVVLVPNEGKVPDAEIDGTGTIHLAYFSDSNVYYIKSSDDGRSSSSPIRVNSEDGFAYGGAYRGPDLALGIGGNIHVIWYNSAYQQNRPTEHWGVMYSRLEKGSSVFEASRNLNRKPSDNFSLAADGTGRVAVIWMAGSIYANLSTNEGETFSAPLDLNTDPCECCGSQAVYTPDGRLAVLYRDKAENYRDTNLSLLPGEGKDFTSLKISQTPWYITSCPMTGSSLKLAGSDLIAGWETQGRIYFDQLILDGQLVSMSETHVTDSGRYPVVLKAWDGKTLVSWKDGLKLKWQMFNSEKEKEEQIKSVACLTVDRPSGVVTRDGRFLLFP